MSFTVTVYTIDPCPYCISAKALLTRKNIPFTEIKLSRNDFDEIVKLQQKSGMRTFPQIFFGEELIGGFDDLVKLDGEHDIVEYYKNNASK